MAQSAPIDMPDSVPISVPIKENERLDVIFGEGLEAPYPKNDGGLFVIQKKRGFRFGTDTVRLIDFAGRKAFRRGLDIGAGSGIIPIMLCAKYGAARFDAIEILDDYADMARRSVDMNNMGGRIRIFHGDALSARDFLKGEQYDLITCNPPYFTKTEVIAAADASVDTARSSDKLTPAAIARIAAVFLTTAGRLCVVMPAHRFLEMCDAVREHGITPKRAQFIQDAIDKPPYLILLECIRRAKPGLHYEPVMLIHP